MIRRFLFVAVIVQCAAPLLAQPSVAINEIMYAPVAPEPEWIELYNFGTASQDISGWRVEVGSKTAILGPATLRSNTYLVLTKDSVTLRSKRPGSYLILQMPLSNLRNSGDTISLRDSFGAFVDSAIFSPSWGGSSGQSAERRDATIPGTEKTNWGSSIASSGATPGLPNSIAVLTGALPLSVVMNEVMFEPIKPEPEWIELLNTTKDTISLAGWQITIEHYSPKTLPSAILPPDSFMVMTASAAALASARGISFSKIITVPMDALSNTGSYFALHDGRGNTIDSVWYDGKWIPGDGISIERVNASRPGYDSSNWLPCEDTTGATPLKPNSVGIVSRDISLSNLTVQDSNVMVTIRNVGRDTTQDISLRLIRYGLDTLNRTVHVALATYDSIRVSIPFPNNCFGVMSCIVYLPDTLDRYRSYDTILFSDTVAIPLDSLVINEIMYDPFSNSCEWVELYNASARTVLLYQATLKTGQKLLHSFAIADTVLLPPQSYGLLASDSSGDSSLFNAYPSLTGKSGMIFFGKPLELSNDSSNVIFENADGSTIDSVHYYKSWQTSLQKNQMGISLERVNWHHAGNDAHNWRSCSATSGGSPLAANSVAGLLDTSSVLAFAASFEPNPFSPDGDGFQDESVLTVTSGDALTYALRVRLFDSRGRIVRTLSDAATLNGMATLLFDGRNDRGQSLPMGLYTALVELTCQNPVTLLKRTMGVAIAGKRK